MIKSTYPYHVAMDMTKFNGQHIVCDVLLAYVLKICCICECFWVCYERRHVDRSALLKLLASLTIVSTKTRKNATYTVQLATLRLASHDVQLMKGNLCPMETMSYTLNEFDMYMEVFTRNWKINLSIPEYLCRSLLHELSVRNLHRLRELIHGGWPQEIATRRGDITSKSPGVWVTPTHRS